MKALGSLGKRACDGLFPLPVEEKAVSGLPSHALGVLSRNACDGLFPLPVEEQAIVESDKLVEI